MSDLATCENCGSDTDAPKYYKPFKYCGPCYAEGTF